MLGSLYLANQGGGAPEVVKAFERARELSHQLGDVSQLVPVLRGLWNINMYWGTVTTALGFAEEALRMAERENHSMSLIAAHRMLGTTLLRLGRFVEARHHLDCVIALHDLNDHDAYTAQVGGAAPDPGVGGLSLLQHTLWCLGYPDQARQTSLEGLELANNLSHPFTSGYALWAASFLHRLCRDPRITQEYAASAIQLSSEHNFPIWESRSSFQHAWALAEQGQVKTSLTQIEHQPGSLVAVPE